MANYSEEKNRYQQRKSVLADNLNGYKFHILGQLDLVGFVVVRYVEWDL